MFYDFACLVFVGMLWGCTNPLIRKGSAGIENIKEKSAIRKILLELKFLGTNWKYMLPFLLNQSGSVLYFLTLQHSDLSLAVPVANALTFVFTAIAGSLLGEQTPNKGTYIGMVLVIAGTILCFLDKAYNKL